MADNEWSKDDEAWFETLAGRDTAIDSKAKREAEVLRRVILEQAEHALDEEDTPSQPRMGEEQLLFRLKREGLLTRGSQTSRWRTFRVPAAAAAVILVALALPLIYRNLVTDTSSVFPGDEGLQFRGPTQTIKVDDPKRTADEICEKLRAIDLPAHCYPYEDRWIIEVPLTSPVPVKLGELLEGYKLEVPNSGRLVVIVSPQGR